MLLIYDHIWLPMVQFLRYPCPFDFPYYYYSFSASVYSLKFSFFCIRYIQVLFWNFPTLSQFSQTSVSLLKFLFLCCSFSDIRVLFEIPLGRNCSLLRNCVNRKGNTIAGNHAFHPIPHSSSPKTKAKIKTNTKTRKKTIDKVTKTKPCFLLTLCHHHQGQKQKQV